MREQLLRYIFVFICSGGFLFIGIRCLFFPEETREFFLSYYKLDEGLKWYDPLTWMFYKPSNLMVRFTGLLSVITGLGIVLAGIAGMIDAP